MVIRNAMPLTYEHLRFYCKRVKKHVLKLNKMVCIIRRHRKLTLSWHAQLKISEVKSRSQERKPKKYRNVKQFEREKKKKKKTQ